MSGLTANEFEALLDRLYPANVVLRNANLTMPRRVNAVAEHLFMHPEIGSEIDRQSVRDQLFSLLDKGKFDFRRTRS